MDTVSDADLAAALTGFCTFLVQGPEFDAGDDVELILVRERSESRCEPGWLPINVTLPDASREALDDRERALGRPVALVRATLSRTGGVPRDSMNLPSDEYDPDALTLSDVRIVDRLPGPRATSESEDPGGGGDAV